MTRLRPFFYGGGEEIETMPIQPSTIPLPARVRLAEANMDAYLDMATDNGNTPDLRQEAYTQAAQWSVIAMELRSRLALSHNG